MTILNETVYGNKCSVKQAEARRHYLIERRETERNKGEIVFRWFVSLRTAKKGGSSFGFLNPDPGPDIAPDALVLRTSSHYGMPSLSSVTVPIVIKYETPQNRLGRLLERLVFAHYGPCYSTLHGGLAKPLPEPDAAILGASTQAEIIEAVRHYRFVCSQVEKETKRAA